VTGRPVVQPVYPQFRKYPCVPPLTLRAKTRTCVNGNCRRLYDAIVPGLEPMTTRQDNVRRPRVNEEIGDAEVQLVDQQGKKLGVVKTEVAIQMAADAGSDLVEIAPDAFPPVRELLDRKLYVRAK